MHTKSQRGFTLIELLVVIALIGILASVILVSLNSARGKARDALRKSTLQQLAQADELYYNDNGVYVATAGYTSNWGPSGGPLVPTYIPTMPVDPSTSNVQYQYWRKDYTGYACMTLNQPDRYAFYAKLENPTAADLATMTDSFDACVQTNWGMNYKMGN
jgi:prepilin-type N-terminal cleavage/methylation domain-containing protein